MNIIDEGKGSCVCVWLLGDIQSAPFMNIIEHHNDATPSFSRLETYKSLI